MLRASSSHLVQSVFELRAKQAEITLDSFGAADHHVVGAGNALRRHDLAGERAEAALHAVADDRTADLLRDGKTDADRRVRILAVADEEQESGCGNTLAPVRGDEVRALGKRD